MTEITPTKLRDFQLCRNLYKCKHVDGLQEKKNKAERDALVDEFDDALVKTIKWFAFETMAGNIPSEKALIWKWSKIWFRNTTPQDIMYGEDHPGKNRNSYNTDANAILNHFHRTHKNPGEVLIMNDHYAVPLTQNTKITGTIDLVVKKGRDIVIEHIGTHSRNAYSKGTELGYKVILDSIAFRHRSGMVENKVTVELLKDKKSFDMVVTDTDIEQVKALADELDNCSNFYPSPGCYFCNQCRFKKNCWTYQQ